MSGKSEGWGCWFLRVCLHTPEVTLEKPGAHRAFRFRAAPSPPLLSAVGGEGGGYEGVLPAGLNSTFWDFGGKGSKGDRFS